MQAINAVLNVFSGDKNILSCCLFGSFARGAATKESDMDLLFAVKAHDERILKGCRDMSAVLGRDISPLVLKEGILCNAQGKRANN
ncbi:MAG: nucleotidyltransferase domain-containing protein [Candidatus Aenigmarchaeota archaeon]|nr:nucleotidyltransferase domain-containing protein [Candidatus Aenigmarchaeota archaeon]MCK5334371.1 nucleotidyltransferase domain-containing protein [Candidatus Aenigmarchaeota archaeon]